MITNSITKSIFQYAFFLNGPFLRIKKNPKLVPKTKMMLKTAKIIQLPYILSGFFIKMVLFDVDLFSPCFYMKSPIYNIFLEVG